MDSSIRFHSRKNDAQNFDDAQHAEAQPGAQVPRTGRPARKTGYSTVDKVADCAGASRNAFGVLQKTACRERRLREQAGILQKMGALGAVSDVDYDEMRHSWPSSLHLDNLRGFDSYGPRLDCVVPFLDPSSSTEVERALRCALLSLQQNQPPCRQISTGEAGVCYEAYVPLTADSGLVGLASVGMPVLQVKFTVRASALVYLEISSEKMCYGAGFMSAVESDRPMHQAVLRKLNPTALHGNMVRKVLDAWSQWAQTQRNSGRFRPMLKDLLLRPRRLVFDLDVRDFCLAYAKMQATKDSELCKIEAMDIFKKLRGDKLVEPLPLVLRNSRLLAKFEKHLCLSASGAESDAYYRAMEKTALWLQSQPPPRLSLSLMCTRWLQTSGGGPYRKIPQTIAVERRLLDAAFAALSAVI